MLVDISMHRKGWRTVANAAEMFLLKRAWRAVSRCARAAARRRPLRPDPLTSLVETARRLDYGCGCLPETPEEET
ncbi:hypothetical protein RKD23_007217 [Streptomyces sp. SAI-170]